LLRSIASGLRSLFRKEQVDRESDEELRAYQEMAAEEKKDGLSRTEALRAVRLERGNLEVSKVIVRSGGWESTVQTCLRFRPSHVGMGNRVSNRSTPPLFGGEGSLATSKVGA